MQRSIKFRAWNKTAREMWSWNDALSTMVGGTGQDLFSRDDLELMQYTNLKDKNDKEIYEGDIVGMPYNNYPQNWEVGELSEYGLQFHRITNKPYSMGYHYRQLRHTELFEVIGNIYENPELKP